VNMDHGDIRHFSIAVGPETSLGGLVRGPVRDPEHRLVPF